MQLDAHGERDNHAGLLAGERHRGALEQHARDARLGAVHHGGGVRAVVGQLHLGQQAALLGAQFVVRPPGARSLLETVAVLQEREEGT